MMPPVSGAAAERERPTILRLFGADDAHRPGPHSTLRCCFESLILPDLQDEERAPGTIGEYHTVLSHWESYTTNPPVSQIDRNVIKAFKTRLVEKPYKSGKQRKKRSNATVNKILRTLRAAITPLWPADRHNPGGHGLVPYFKFPPMLDRVVKLPFVFTRAEMTALYNAADACRPAQRFRPSLLYRPELWQAAMVLALNTGARTWDLYRLRWQDIRWGDFRHGSITFVARKTAKFQRLPLNRCARRHLEHLRSLCLDGERVFPGFAKNKSFYAAWKRITHGAGVHVPFESFRKTCSTLHEDCVPRTGEWITGHGLRGVNAENYQNPTDRVFRAIYRLRQPKGFRLGERRILSLLAGQTDGAAGA
jgi:integrase